MGITLEKAFVTDAEEIYDMQIKSFCALLQKYEDYDFSPGAEKLSRTLERFNESITDYYFISLGGCHIGAARICNFGALCKIKQIFILPQYQNNGYAQVAINDIEALYPDAQNWELDTILQEEKLCYLYEKMGYKKTGKIQNIKDDMDIVFYAK